MEIKLSDEDFERLAASLERRITDRVVGLTLQNPAWEVMTEEAKKFTLRHIGADTFKAQAVQSLAAAMQSHGRDSLNSLIRQAVRDLHATDPELKKAVAKGVYDAAVEYAERLRVDYN